MKEYIRNNIKVHISDSVLTLLEGFKQKKKTENESGGILLGQIKEDSIYVLRATIPNEFDTASRFHFECNRKTAQIIINHEFYNSGQKTIYLGEWHTHPEKTPTPSVTDLKMIRSQFKRNKLNEPFLILIIQGLNGIFLALYDGEQVYTS